MKKLSVALLAAFLAVWIGFSWIVPGWLHLSSRDLLILRLSLLALGVAAAIVFLWLNWRAAKGAPRRKSATADDLDLAFAEATARLKGAHSAKPRLSALPVVLMMGDSGAAKTTIVLRSGIDAELLAGQAFAGEAVAPTSNLNIWLARGTVFLDPASAVIEDRGPLARLAEQIALPGLTGREAEPRSVVVCVDCEEFLKPRAAESFSAKARNIREQLQQLSASLGIALPVYVLFTKMDRLPHFFDYTAYLDDEEARQAFGATLPFESSATPGTYAERQTARVSDAFLRLYTSLCDNRLSRLAREHDEAKLPNIYEFPREFRKIRSLAVQFLVEICRPSQLQVSPVLRGFYFTGVRPVNVSDIIPAPARVTAETQVFEKDATRFFRPARTAEPVTPPQVAGSRRVPQWVYLGRLFPDIVLADRSAAELGRTSIKTGRARRAALIAASVLGLVLVGVWTISFIANYRLASTTLAAARSADNLAPQGGTTVQALEHLAAARESAGLLASYETNGAPLHMRWGLYTGDELYEPAYRSWFKAFRTLLLAPSQSELVKALSQPQTWGARNYRSVYDALKAYLITTSNPDKNPDRNPSDFLAPVLVQYWPYAKSLPPDQFAAVKREVEFYSDQLRFRHPWPYRSRPDDQPVDIARAYLNHLSAVDSLYDSITTRVDQQPPLVFNRLYAGSDRAVSNVYPVPGAFTKAGWGGVRSRIQNVADYFKGEEWVLGSEAFANVDKSRLQTDLQNRYKADFIKYWREYLRRTSVLRFNSIKDAADKLSLLGGNQSPLLEALCLVSENTSVDAGIVDLFQPPRVLTPPGCKDRLSSPGNDSYVQALIGMQASLSALSTEETNDSLRGDALSKATAAEVVVQQIARSFPVDKEGVIDSQTHNLIEAPVKYVQALLAGVPTEEANAAARGFCSAFNGLMKQYPFSPSSLRMALLKDVGGIFAPTEGALWKLYQDNLQKSLTLVGNHFAARPGANPQPNASFVNFLNRAAAVSEALYRGGSQPQLSFNLRVNPDQDVQSVSLTINGQTLNYSSATLASQHFVWPGAGPEGVKMRVKFSGGSEFDYPQYSGTWSAFRFFADAEQWQEKGIEYTMEKPLRTSGGVVTVPATGHPASVHFTLDMEGAAPILKPGYLSGLVCVPIAASR